jgi:hypothetical protein
MSGELISTDFINKVFKVELTAGSVQELVAA